MRFLLLLAACLGVLHSVLGAADRKPNIILMLADDLGYGEPGCYGNPQGRTPNMDRLAAAGVRFTNGYAASNVCSPSRAALLTGRYVQRWGPIFEDYFGGLCPGLEPARDLTLGRMLQDAGYATGCFGKWNVSHSRTKGRVPANAFGFDRWVGLHLNHDYYTHRVERTDELDLYEDGQSLDRPSIWSDTLFADEAIRFIEQHREHPFFIYLPWQAPHTPLQDPEVPNAPVVGVKSRAIVEKMIQRLDVEIGRVLEAVKRHGLAENTLILLTSDNGGALNMGRNAPLRGWKQELWEGGIRVPMIASWPGVISAGRVVDTPVSHLDLTATIARISGTATLPEHGFDGVDLLPLLKGDQADLGDRHLFWRRRIVKGAGEPTIKQSSVRHGDWTYIRSYALLPGSGGAAYGSRFTEELYNLNRDIAQADNLIAAEAERLKTLQAALDDWEKAMAADAARLDKRSAAASPGTPMASKLPRTADRAINFQHMDKNSDGFLTPEEFTPAGVGQNEATRRFLNFDRNGDGRLSREEYASPPPP
jgi:arylsulfatase A-like enzyme